MNPRIHGLLAAALVLLLVVPAGASPDIEADAVAALLSSPASGLRAEPDEKALAGLLEVPGADAWLLVEQLIARDRADLARRLALLTDASVVGPLRAYAAAPPEAAITAKRLAAVRAAREALQAGQYEAVLRHAAAAREGGGRLSAAALIGELYRGNCLATTGKYPSALDAWLRAGREALTIGWWAIAAKLFGAATQSAFNVRSLGLLARSMEGLRALREAQGDAVQVASVVLDLGSIAHWRGDLPGAIRHYDEALGRYELLGQAEGMAEVRGLRSVVLAQSGQMAEALEDQAAVAAHHRDRPRDEVWASSREQTGLVRFNLGDTAGAAVAFEEALATYRELGNRGGEATALGNLGLAHMNADRWKPALEALRGALQRLQELHDPLGIAMAENNVADGLRRSGLAAFREAAQEGDAKASEAARARALAALREAEPLATRAVVRAQKVGAEGAVCAARHTRAQIRLALGRVPEAAAEVERVRQDAARLRAWRLEVNATVTLARCRAVQRDWSGAMREARRAGEELLTSFAGLPEADLARVRQHLPDVFDIGAAAAVQARRGDEMFFFVEAGRAMGLLRGLGGRAAALGAVVPPEQAARLAAATRAKVEAFAAWQASRGSSLARRRALWGDYEARRDAETKVLEEIERVKTAAARRLAPARPITAKELMSRLGSTARAGLRQAFLLYNFQSDGGLVVIAGEEASTMKLYSAQEVRELEDAMATLAAARNGRLDPEALAVAQRLLIDRLGLPAGPTRLFVCPDRQLAYVPLSVLVPDDWEVVWEPSATTFEMLTERRFRRGRGVLAVGDPDYRGVADAETLAVRGGPRLLPLPGTRAEVGAIAGGKSDIRLLGGEATEGGLRKALASRAGKAPWQSVHFACHGLVDVEHPPRSCLALTPGGGEDGYLTSREVLGLDLRTDLAVLSACQTGRGKYVRGEGLMSLARSFMYAGAPRVIVSLWDVDDAATSFLMRAFYRAWNEGCPAATALRMAQRAVRDHEVEVPAKEPGQPSTVERPWADPRYWGAWVLWGLPD